MAGAIGEPQRGRILEGIAPIGYLWERRDFCDLTLTWYTVGTNPAYSTTEPGAHFYIRATVSSSLGLGVSTSQSKLLGRLATCE